MLSDPGAECQVCRGCAVDDLTGLLTRRAWETSAEHALSAARQRGQPVGLIVVDLDGFKMINENFGHLAGDTVLAEVARRITIAAPSDAILGRYGGRCGDEILVLCPIACNDQARAVAEDLRREVKGLAVQVTTTSGDYAVITEVTASAGITAWPPDAEGTVDDLIRAADTGLLAAKRCGRDQVVVLDHDRRDHLRAAPATVAPRVHDWQQASTVLSHEDCLHHLATYTRMLHSKWTPSILVALAPGPLRRGELLAAIRQGSRTERIQGSIFDRAIKRLCANGLLRRFEDRRWPRRVRYDLSDNGRDLLIATIPGMLWSQRHLGVRHTTADFGNSADHRRATADSGE